MLKCCGSKKKSDPKRNDGIRMVLITGIIAVYGFAAAVVGIKYGRQLTGLFGNEKHESAKNIEDEEWETVDYTWEEVGEPFAVMDGQIMLTIAEAAVAEDENSGIEGFPQEDKLIAVSAKIQGIGEGVPDMAAGELYVRYLSSAGQYVYKKNIFPNDLTALGRDYGTGLDMYDFIHVTQTEGNFMFFIDPEATEIDLYLSDLNSGKEIQAVYRMNLPVTETYGSALESESETIYE